MKRRKAAARKARARKQRNRRVALTVYLMLAVCLVSVGGTIAWLQASTTPVVNTFAPAGIEISLTETYNTDKNDDGTNDAWTAQLVPGKEYTKDPEVAVEEATDVDVWLFVKVDEEAQAYLDYTLTLTAANGWTQGDGTNIPANVWYREVKTNDSVKSWNLLDGNKVTVKSSLDENGMPDDDVTLSFQAYAIQTEGFDTVEAAWAEASKSASTT